MTPIAAAFLKGETCGQIDYQLRLLAWLGVVEHAWQEPRSKTLVPHLTEIARRHGYEPRFVPASHGEDDLVFFAVTRSGG